MAGIVPNFHPLAEDDDVLEQLRQLNYANTRKPYRVPLPAQESEGLGKRILGGGMNALEYVGGTLAKPGRAVRGVLTGDMGAVANLIPFSDTLGITDPEKQVTGRDLTNKFGITNAKEKGFLPWAAGVAADVLTDPLTLVGGIGPRTARTALGETAAKIGATRALSGRQLLKGFNPAQATELLGDASKAGQPLGGLIRLGLPGGTQHVLGTGETAQKIAGLTDRAGDWLKYGNRVGVGLNKLFDPEVGEATTGAAQRAMKLYGTPARREAEAQGRQLQQDLISHLIPVANANLGRDAEVLQAARMAGEGAVNRGLVNPNLAEAVQPAGDIVRQIGERQAAQMRELGLGKTLDEGPTGVKYVPRQATSAIGAPRGVGGGSAEVMPTRTSANIHRKDWMSDIPGGSLAINDWMRRYAGTKGQPVFLRQQILSDMLEDASKSGALDTLGNSGVAALDKQARGIAKKVARGDVKYREQDFISPNLLGDIQRRSSQHAAQVGNATAIVKGLADIAQPMREGLVPIGDVIKNAKLSTIEADLAAGVPAQGGLVQMHKALAEKGIEPSDYLAPTKEILAKINRFGVDPKEAAAYTAKVERPAIGEALKGPLGLVDSFNSAFKGLVYPMFPGSHVRNAATAFVNNLREGFNPQDYAAMRQIMTGVGNQDLSRIMPSLKGLPLEEQAKQLRSVLHAHAGLFSPNIGMLGEGPESIKNAIQTGGPLIPKALAGEGIVRPGSTAAKDTANLVLNEGLLGTGKAIAKTAQEGIGGIADKNRGWGQALGENLGIRGVGGAAETALPAINAGQKVGENVENFFRGALMNRLMSQGYKPEIAADLVRKYHFSYDEKTRFQRDVMSRIMPFGTFAMKNAALTADTLMHNPRFAALQMKPFFQNRPGQEGYVPQYLRENGLAIPMGDEENGNRQYLSGLGLPIEEGLQRYHLKNGIPDIRATMLDLMGSTSPLIKGPAEQIADTQFFSGRRLSDLRPQGAVSAIGKALGEENPQFLAQLLANSPASRAVSVIDKLIDPRKSFGQKALNTLSGARVTDVPVERQQSIELRNALNELLRQSPHVAPHIDYTPRKNEEANLTPNEIDLLRLAATQQIQAQERARAEKKQAILNSVMTP